LNIFSGIQNLFERALSYRWWEVAIELIIIWLVVYAIIRFVQGTRAAGALKGLLALTLLVFMLTLIPSAIGASDAFQRLQYLFDRALGFIALGLVVVFQPELRRALTRLGEAPFFRSTPGEIALVVDAVVEAAGYLSKAKFGAIIVIERQARLEGLVEGGTRLDAKISSRLLQTIFFPSTALHDLAVIIRGSVIHAAGVQLPMADAGDMPDPRLGARHRAAVGLTKECDALVVIVSEETGHIRIVERGRLSDSLSPDGLREQLSKRLRREPPKSAPTAGEEADAALVSSAEAEEEKA
jgi:diadenylate cyclase